MFDDDQNAMLDRKTSGGSVLFFFLHSAALASFLKCVYAVHSKSRTSFKSWKTFLTYAIKVDITL